VGTNFHGIPSATSALNCTTISLQEQQQELIRQEHVWKTKRKQLHCGQSPFNAILPEMHEILPLQCRK
jgi:hypothetical protein